MTEYQAGQIAMSLSQISDTLNRIANELETMRIERERREAS